MSQTETTHLSLWTRDFTIITLGSVVSMVGNSLSGFAMSLMVLDYTSSPLFYAIYVMAFTFPQIAAPIFSGALLDRFSRKKTIYTLDFISAALYLASGVLLSTGWFSYPVFALLVFLFGTIQSVYQVAYQSFYPMLITKGNYSKAYSIASILESVSVFIVPMSTFIYNRMGIAPLMMANSVCFFTAAVMEKQIRAEEKYVEAEKGGGIRRMLSDTREGFTYLKSERGLFFIAFYFLFSSLGGGVSNVALLPYLKSSYPGGEYYYLLIGFFMMAGRSITSVWHYRHTLPTERKFTIALTVYLLIALSEGTMLFMPLAVMFAMSFASGCLGVTSYTIRVSATQSYVPDEKKGRFNGAFNVLSVLGALIGQGAAGLLSEIMDLRFVMLLTQLAVFTAAIVIIKGHKRDVSAIYNRQQ